MLQESTEYMVYLKKVFEIITIFTKHGRPRAIEQELQKSLVSPRFNVDGIMGFAGHNNITRMGRLIYISIL